MEHCIYCQGELDPITGRCRKCGWLESVPLSAVAAEATAVLSTRCPHCGKILPARAHFCPACGYRLRALTGQASAKDVQKVPAPVVEGPHQDAGHLSAPQVTSAKEEEHLHERSAREVATSVGATQHQDSAASSVRPKPPVMGKEHQHEQGLTAEKEETRPHEESVKEGGVKEEEEEEEGPLAAFGKRRIVWRNLSHPLKILLIVTVVQILIVAVLLLAQNIPQLQVDSGVIDGVGTIYVVPITAFVVLIISLGVGYWWALVGALQVHWSVRFLVIALVTVVLGLTPITHLIDIASVPGAGLVEPSATEVRLRWVQLGVLAVFWVWALGVSVARWQTKRKAAGSQTQTQVWRKRTFVGVLVLLLIYYSLEFGVWLAYAVAGHAATGAGFFLFQLGGQSETLIGYLTLILFLGSTDLLEWGEIIAGSVVSATKRMHASWFFLILTPLVAIGMIVNVLHLDGSEVVPELIIAAVLTGVVVSLVRFAQVRSDWPLPAQVRSLIVLVGAIFLYVYGFFLPNRTNEVALFLLGFVPQILTAFSILVSTPIVLATLTIGVFLVARGRMGKPKQGAVGLFLVMVILLAFTPKLPSFLSAAGFPVAFLPQSFSLVNGIQMLAALGVLAWMVSLLVQRQALTEETKKTLASAFLLLASLQVISWVLDLLNGIATLSSNSVLWLAGLFLLTVFWSLITAGEQVTNTDSATYPREGRTLLYLGYTLVASSILLYLGSLRAQVTGAAAASYLTTDYASLQGLAIIGPPVVALAFILGVGRRLPRATAVASASPPASRVSPKIMQLEILGSGALVTALVVALVLFNALPRLVHTSNLLFYQPYSAKIPGPGCAPGGAVWSVAPGEPISTHCLPTGLQVTADPGKSNWVSFLSVPFPQDYSVSVHVDLSHWPKGCVGIESFTATKGVYASTICRDGSWAILDQSGIVLATGRVVSATAYTIEAISNSPNQRLVINGVQVGTVSYTNSRADANIIDQGVYLTLDNTGSVKGFAVFSDFVFTPLPEESLASRQATYQAFTPGLNCDKGKAQWALMTLNTTATQCLSTGTQIEVQARSGGVIGFTPPSSIFPQNYRVSVLIDLSKVSDGCAFIVVRALGDNYYQYSLCTGGLWGILLVQRSHTAVLAQGQVPFAAMYEIEATVDGPNLHLAINGTEVGSASNSVFTATAFIALGLINASQDAQAVVFSNFVFKPLP